MATTYGTSFRNVGPDWTYQAHFAGESLYSAKDSVVKSYSTTGNDPLTLFFASNGAVTLSVSPGGSYELRGSIGGLDNNARPIAFTATSPISINNATVKAREQNYGTPMLPAPTTPGNYTIQSPFAGDGSFPPSHSNVVTLTVTSSANAPLNVTSPKQPTSTSVVQQPLLVTRIILGAVLVAGALMVLMLIQ